MAQRQRGEDGRAHHYCHLIVDNGSNKVTFIGSLLSAIKTFHHASSLFRRAFRAAFGRRPGRQGHRPQSRYLPERNRIASFGSCQILCAMVSRVIDGLCAKIPPTFVSLMNFCGLLSCRFRVFCFQGESL